MDKTYEEIMGSDMNFKVKNKEVKIDKDGWFCVCPDCEKKHRVGMSEHIKMFICSFCGKSIEVMNENRKVL
jgi:Fe2+ or Zn2+ uptake regulation protein